MAMSLKTPFDDLLHINDPPTSLQCAQVKASLKEATNSLQQVTQDLEGLSGSLDRMNEEKGLLLLSIEEHRNLLSPFRCLPDDILGEIFVCCLPTDHPAVMLPSMCPLLLGYVCRRWRTVAYRTPRLWASLHIALPKAERRRRIRPYITSGSDPQFHECMKKHQEAINEWFKRSGSCLLYVSLSLCGLISPSLSYIDLLLSLSARVQHLELGYIPSLALAKFADVSSTAFPNLRTLHMSFERSIRRINKADWVFNGLFSSPRLSGLRIHSLPVYFSDISSSWRRLTRLDINGNRWRLLDTSAARTIFTNCPLLTHCSIRISRDAMIQSDHIPIRLAHLHTLYIRDDSNCLGELFQDADIPCLRELSYISDQYTPNHRQHTLLCILSGTNMGLERLTAVFYSLNGTHVSELLTLCPKLTHLYIVHSSSAESSGPALVDNMLQFILKQMAPITDRPPSLPALTVLHIEEDNRLTLQDQELLRFIQWRMGAGPPVASLKEVVFRSSRYAQIDIASQLVEYINDGLKLQLTYAPVSLYETSKTRRTVNIDGNDFVIFDEIEESEPYPYILPKQGLNTFSRPYF